MTREEAIKMLVNATYSDEWQGNEDLTTANHMAIEALKQPEQKKAKWMMNSGLGTLCSNCYYKLETTGLLSRCPNCGAEMMEKEDG